MNNNESTTNKTDRWDAIIERQRELAPYYEEHPEVREEFDALETEAKAIIAALMEEI